MQSKKAGYKKQSFTVCHECLVRNILTNQMNYYYHYTPVLLELLKLILFHYAFQIDYNELINFIEVTGVCMQETYLGVKRKEVDGFFSFLGTIFNALTTHAGRKFTQVHR